MKKLFIFLFCWSKFVMPKTTEISEIISYMPRKLACMTKIIINH